MKHLITIFNSKGQEVDQVTPEELFRRIKTGYYSEHIKQARSRLDPVIGSVIPEALDALPKFAFTYHFSIGEQSVNSLPLPPFIIREFFDYSLEDLEAARAHYLAQPSTVALFDNASGNGFVYFTRITTDCNIAYEPIYSSISHIQDSSGKVTSIVIPIGDLIHVSDDPALYLNPEAIPAKSTSIPGDAFRDIFRMHSFIEKDT